MKHLLTSAAFTTLFLPLLALAQPAYVPLVTIPNVGNNLTDFDAFINALYALSISIAALLAVIKIIIAGVKWMTTDVVTSKGQARSDIRGALLGLIVVLGAVLILTVINPQLTDVDLAIDKMSTPSFSSGPTANVALNPSLVTTAPNFDYMSTNESIEQQKAFIQDCESKANHELEEPQGSGVLQCYDVGAGNVLETGIYCEGGTDCNQKLIDINSNQNNPNYCPAAALPDPSTPDEYRYYCIYPSP